MSKRLPWTKLQDFYLRLGFLKILVASLSWERRSATNESIIRRLEHPLFDAIGTRTEFGSIADTLIQATEKKSGAGSRSPESVEVVEVLVSEPSLPSALYAITRKTAYKVVDWGRDIGFLARANQISERALLLKSLLMGDESQRFIAGDPTAWNPFTLSVREKLFFLYHALENDLVVVELIERLGAMNEVIETRLASQMTCSAMFSMLEASERLTDADSIREHRTALDLALTIADEVEAPVPARWARHALQARSLRETKLALRRAAARSAPLRKTRKNADHQTIPRFEQLVDLGFLSKPDADATDPAVSLAARRRWRYIPTEACRRWSRAVQRRESAHGGPVARSKHGAFAALAVEAFASGSTSEPHVVSLEEAGRRVWVAYSAVGRSVGFSPVDSVALRAMLDAAAEGVIFEMHTVHRLLVLIKERDLLGQEVQFAAGTTLETMFVRIRPAFVERLAAVAPQISEDWNR